MGPSALSGSKVSGRQRPDLPVDEHSGYAEALNALA